MTWTIEPNPMGLWTVHNQVGRPVMDIAFRGDIPEPMRQKILSSIAAMPALGETSPAVDNPKS